MRAIAPRLVIWMVAFFLAALVTLEISSAQTTPPAVKDPELGRAGVSDTSSMLRLKWKAPDTAVVPPITGYEVQYRIDGETGWTDHVFDSDGSTTETTITGLKSHTGYYARVRAINDDGPGVWSQGPLWAMTERARLTLALSAATYRVGEGETITATVTVTPDADQDLTVTVEITNGTGATLSGLDTDNMLTIEKGQSSASFTISAEDDDDADNDEVTLELRTDEYDYYQVLGNPSTAVVTIVDDEGSNNPPVITTTSPVTVQENETAVATLEATDSDDDPITGWSISGGADSTLFSLTNGGVLTFVTAPDYENPKDDSNDNSYEVKVTASDGTDDSSELTLTVNVTDVNEPPPSMKQPGFSAAGTSDTTSMLILRWVAPTLPEGTPFVTGYDVQYRVQGETNWVTHYFESDGSTTETTITGLASNTHYDAQVRAVNVEGQGGWSPTSEGKTAEARLTVAFSSDTYSVGEGEETTITVTVTPVADCDMMVAVEITDGTGATLSGLTNGMLTIARGQNSGSFTISGDQDDDVTDNAVTLTLSPYEYACNVVLGSPSTATVTIEEGNNPPVVTTASPITTQENQTAVATLEATDTDDDPITGWSVTGGADRALFSLTDDGVLTFVTASDYENPRDAGRDNGYEVAVTASDETDDSTPLTLTVNVTDVNEPPGPPTGLSISPNQSNPASALDVIWVPPDTTGIPEVTGYEVQHRIGDSGAWTTHNFNSVGTTTKTTIPDLASNTTYQVQVRAVNDEGEGRWTTDSGNTQKARLTVAFRSATYSVDEGNTAAATVTVTPTADRDVTVTVTMSGTGATLSGLGSDNTLTINRGQSSASFTVSGDQDEDAINDEVTLTLSTDDDGVSVVSPSTTTVTIIDDEVPNFPPAFATTTVDRIIPEDSLVGTLLGDPIAATDPEDDPLTYSLSGDSAENFKVSNEGQITLDAKLNHEEVQFYTLTLSVRDNKDGIGNPDSNTDASVTVNITVGDVDEPPGTPTDLSVSVNDNNPTTALDLSWTAPNTSGIPPITGYDVQYRIRGESNWIDHAFDSVGTTTETTIPNLASNTTYKVQVRAKNDEGESQWAMDSGTTEKAQLTLAFNSATYMVGEGDTATTTVTVTPPADRDVTVTVEITDGTGATLSGLNNGMLTIKRGQNSASFTISGDQDADAMNDEVVLTLTTDDDSITLGSASTSTVTIIDDEEPNSPPVITATSTITVRENKTAVANLEATDSDNDPITRWSITGGADSTMFNLTNGGELSFNAAPDYENPIDSGADNSYMVEVTASDGTDHSTPKTITVNVTDVDEPPGAPTDLSVSTNEDNPTTALDVRWTAPDTTGIPDTTGYDVQYRAGDSGAWIDHDFNSVGTTTMTTVPDLASNTTYQLQVRAENDEGEGQWATDSGTTKKAQLTVAFSSATYTVGEGDTSTSTVTVTPTADRDVTVTVTTSGIGATISGLNNGMLTIMRGQNSASFTISGDQDNDAVDGEVILTLSADDHGVTLGNSATVTIEDDEVPNFPPAFATTTVNRIIPEDSLVATLLGGPITATDPEGDSLTYSLSGESSEHFEVSNLGQITLSGNLNHETTPSYTLILSVSDGKDGIGNPNLETDATITVNVTVGDVNEPPDAPTDLSVSTNDDNPTTALDLSWTAPNTSGIPPITGYDVQYRIRGESNWIDHAFDSVGTTTTTIHNLASNTTFQVQVRAKNDEGEGQWATSNGTTEKAQLTVAFSASTYMVGEGDTATTMVTVTPTADRDVTVTVEITDGTGATLSGLTNEMLIIKRGQNSASFTISGDQDEDAMNDEVILTLSTHDGGVILGSPATVSIVDDEEPNNPPVVTTTSPLTVHENQTAVSTLEATDSDNDPITRWSITGGADSTMFNLTNGGELSFNAAPDYENPIDSGADNSYMVEVTASDGTDHSTPKTITVNVTDVDEPPGAPTDLSVSTNEDNPTTALDVRWTAPDTTGIPDTTGYDVQYRAGDSGAWIDHDFNSVGTTTMTTVPDLASNTTYQLQVRAENDEGEGQWATDSGTTKKAQLTVAFSSATYTVGEGDTATTTVTVTPTADRDVTVTVTTSGIGATISGLGSDNTLTINRGQSSASFTVSGDQDEDAINDEVILALTTDDSSVTLDSPSTSTVTIIDDEEPNTPPVITATSTITVRENKTAVANLEATDSDNDPITEWSITGGAESTLFDLTNGGDLSFNAAPDYENPIDSGADNSYMVEVTASDGTDHSTPKTITVNVINVNEPPTFPQSIPTIRTVAENSPGGTLVGGLFTADDPEDDVLVHELSGTGRQNFAVDSNGQITVASSAVLDFETLSTYTMELSVSDAKDADGNADSEVDDTITITINLTDEPPPPRMALPGFSAAGAADTTSMLILRWTAPILPEGTPRVTGYDVRYRMQGETDWIDHDFDSVATTTETTVTRLASNTYYDAQVRAVNVEGPGAWSPISSAKTAEAWLTVAFSVSTYTAGEGDTATTTVTVTPTADRDVTVTVTMTGSGATVSGLDTDSTLTIIRGQSSASFTISGEQDNDATDDEVTLTLSTDHVGVTLGSPSTSTVTIIDDEVPNFPPAFAVPAVSRSISEDSPVGASLGDAIAATDPEGDSLTYTLSGEGSEHFNVNSQGRITLSASLNHEDATSFTLSLSVRDGKDDVGNPDSNTDASITVNVIVGDVDEPPGAPTDLSVSTNEDNPTTALDVRWTAPDTTGIPDTTGYDVQYRAGDSGAWIDHDFNSVGTTTMTTVPDLASNTTYQLQVRAENDEGEGQWATDSGTTKKAQLTVAFSSATYTVGEGDTATTTVTVTPPADRDVTVTVEITNGTGATLSGLTNEMLIIKRGQNSASFTVSGDQDEDAINDEVILALTTDDSSVTLDSPSTSTVTIIDDEEPNTPPVITATSTITVRENKTAVANLEATDSDNDPITEWSITGGAESTLFDLTNGGELSFNAAPDYENPIDSGADNSYMVEVTASDGTDHSDS